MNIDDLTPDQIPGDHLAIISCGGRYASPNPNRRSRRAMIRGSTAQYHYYYRDSWNRYQKHIPKCLKVRFDPSAPITVTITNTTWRSQ